MKTRQQAVDYGLTFKDTYMETPFRDTNWQLIRVKGSKKAFLWIYERNGFVNLNVKVDPQWRDFWRETYKSVIAGYHQNKEHWNTIILDGTISDKEIKRMIAESYDIITDSPTKRIYEAVKKIPKGHVATYGRIAEMAGEPKMARAVGNALHKNPDPEHIPCFRVVNSKGELSGAFAFDGENVWICHSNSNTLERISYEYITTIANDVPGYCIDASALSDEYRLKNTPSCITCYGGRLWVATHTRFFDSEMYSYSYDKEADKLTAVSSYNLPSKVQGVAFDDNGSIYLSTSYGRNNSSYLKVYASLLALDKKPNDPKVKVEMPPCSEEVAIADDTVFVLFESASAKYFEGTDGMGKSPAPIDKLLEVSVASIW